MSTYMDEITAKLEAERAAKAEEADEERLPLALALWQAGVQRVEITFSGYGDEGTIERPEIKMKEGSEPISRELTEVLTDWAEKHIEGTGVDWYNNDGGFGEIVIDFTQWPATFVFEISQNETVSNRVEEECEEGYF